MTAPQALLAATDFSAPSRHAAQRAAMLAKEGATGLELVHVLETRALDELRRLFGAGGEELQARIRAQAAEALSHLATEVGAAHDLTISQHLLEGTVLDCLVAHAERIDASILVVGARGTAFMRHWLLGATAERMLRKSPRPVLIVKQPPREVYRSVLVPVDFSGWSLGAIRQAQAIAPQADLVLLHAYEAPFEGKMRFAGVDDAIVQRHRSEARRDGLAQLQRIAGEAGLAANAWRSIVVHGDAAPRVLEQEEEQGADLIVLGKHGAGMAEELLLGSVTKHVLSQARCDVLVAHR